MSLKEPRGRGRGQDTLQRDGAVPDRPAPEMTPAPALGPAFSPRTRHHRLHPGKFLLECRDRTLPATQLTEDHPGLSEEFK